LEMQEYRSEGIVRPGGRDVKENPDNRRELARNRSREIRKINGKGRRGSAAFRENGSYD